MFKFFRSNQNQTDPSSERVITLERMLDATRQSASEAWKKVITYQRDVRLLNRAIARRNRTIERQRARLEAITGAAIALRKAQRQYMSDRGNDAFDCEVARAAHNLDVVLPPYTQRDKQLAAINGAPVLSPSVDLADERQ